MATHKSAEKRARQALRRQSNNNKTRSAIKTFEKKIHVAVQAKKGKDAQEVLSLYMSKLMKAAKKGIFHWRTASRKISRLSSLVNKL